MKRKSRFGIVGAVFSFLGFGCIACGQTLLYPVLLFIFTNISGGLFEYLGNISMILGIILVVFGIKGNLKIIENDKICKI